MLKSVSAAQRVSLCLALILLVRLADNIVVFNSTQKHIKQGGGVHLTLIASDIEKPAIAVVIIVIIIKIATILLKKRSV